MNGSAGVTERTRLLVAEACERHGFIPNRNAVGLVRGRTNLVGVVVPYITDDFYNEFIELLDHAASASGYQIVYRSSYNASAVEADIIKNFLALKVCGMVIVPVVEGPEMAVHDYFTHLTSFEPKRAAIYGIQHYCWICINPKEADNLELAREVIGFIPEFLERPNVLGVGEIGLNRNSASELKVFEEQVDLAVRLGQLIWIHTPHLDDKRKGTRMMLDALRNHAGVEPGRVTFDHMEEHTLKDVLDAGYWAAMTIYPMTKNSPARVIDSVERFGLERMMVDASGDWGPSDPATLHHAILEMRRRGHRERDINTLFYNNPCRFLGQCPTFLPKPDDE